MNSIGRIFVSACILCALVMFTSTVTPCPACYGDLDSPTGDGMNLAILFLLVVTGGVLSAFVSFFVYMRKRTRLITDGIQSGTLVLSNKKRVL